MRKHVKKALKHDFKVAGKTIPTLLIVGLFLVGGGSAALLSSFGTVSGTANVDQAVVLNGGDEFSFNGAQTAGETVIDTRTLQNNANVSAEVDFATEYVTGDSVEDASGVSTRYVEYFDDAGHDFNEYTSSAPDHTVSSGESIQTAIKDAETNDVIVVEDGTYDPFTVDKDVTVVAANAPDTADNASITGEKTGIEVTADGATVKGFNVDPADQDGPNARGILVKAKDVRVDSNYVHSVVSNDRAIGVYVYGHGTNTVADNTEVINNKVETVNGAQRNEGITINEDSDGSADSVRVSGNTVTGIGGTNQGISAAIAVDGGYAQDFEISLNRINDVSHQPTEQIPYSLAVYVTGYTNEGYGDGAVVTDNSFEVSGTTADVGTFDNSNAGNLDANNNWFGTNGMHVASDVDASWADVNTTVEANSEDTFGIINEFAINLAPGDYTVKTDVVPAAQN